MPKFVRPCLTILALAATLTTASADSFSDDFESGTLSPSLWLLPGSGQIVVDPLNSSNHVLSFSQLAKGGDIFSVPLNLSGPVITLSFDYLGVDSTPSVGTDTGGFIIVDTPNTFSGFVLLGTSVAGGPKLPDMLNLAPGVWHHIAVSFAPALVAAGNGSKFTFEEWATSPNAAGYAYFDNIQVEGTPEPVSGYTFAAGLGLLALLRRKRGFTSQ